MAYEGAKRGKGKGTQCSGTNHFLRCVFHLTSFIWMHFQPYIRKIGPKYIRDFFSIRETSYSLRGSGAVILFSFPNVILILWGTLLLTSALNGINFLKISSWPMMLIFYNRITLPQLHLLDDIKFFQISIFYQFTGQNMRQRDKNAGILF